MAILKRAISMDASAVSTVIDATDMVSEIEKIHKTFQSPASLKREAQGADEARVSYPIAWPVT